MARLSMSGLDDIVEEMKKMGELSGKAADAMIVVGANETRDAWQQVAREHGYHDTGAMIESVGYRYKPGDIRDARVAVIYPQGKDKKGMRNAEKAFLLHYGTHRIQASYWVDKAEAVAEKKAYPAMEKVWDDYIRTGQLPNVEMPEFSEEGSTGKTTRRTESRRKKRSWLDEHFEKALHCWY